MIVESVEETCVQLSKHEEWLDIAEIVYSIRAAGLNREQTELALQFLKAYFLEVDESGSKARLLKCMRRLFKSRSSRIP